MNFTPSQFLRFLYSEKDFLVCRFIPEKGTNKGRPFERVAHGVNNALGIFNAEWPTAEFKFLFPCVGVNPRDEKGKVITQRTAFVDIDGAPLPAWARERADAICSRDDTHHHLFFIFRDREENAESRKTYSAIVKRLLVLTGSKEKSAHDSARVFRIPGVPHRKNGVLSPEYKCVFLRNNLHIVDFEDRFKFLSGLEKGEPAQQTSGVATPAPVAPNAVNFLRATYKKKDKIGEGDGRSQRLFFLGLDCHSWGVTLDSALALAHEINTDFLPPETAQTVDHQIKSAYKYARGEFGALAERAKDGTEAKQRSEMAAFKRVQKVRDAFSSWRYIHDAARFSDLNTARSFSTTEQIENYISQVICEPVKLRDLLARDALQTCDAIDYNPTDTARVFERDGMTFFNSYRPAPAARRDADLKKSAVRVFKEHVAFIATNENEEKNLLSYFAYLVQNPGCKVDWAPLIISPKEGLGKSAFAKLFANIFGAWNCSSVDDDDLTGAWTDFVAEKLFVVSHEVETHEKTSLKKLKKLITETRVSVKKKYARTYETENRANFLFLSNKINALRIGRDARRFFVIVNKKEPRERAYYATLFDAFERGAGWVADYLMSLDLSHFAPHGDAPKTEGLDEVAEASKPESVAWIEKALAAKAGEIIDLDSFVSETRFAAPIGAAGYVSRPAVVQAMTASGYERRQYKSGGTSHRVWFRGDAEAFAEALKRMKEKVAKIA